MIPIPAKTRQPEGDNPCVICGKRTNRERLRFMAHVWLGAYLITQAEAADLKRNEPRFDAGDGGLHPVGPECAKRSEFKPYLVAVSAKPVTKRRLSVADAKAILQKGPAE